MMYNNIFIGNISEKRRKNEKVKKRCVYKPPAQKIETLKDESLER